MPAFSSSDAGLFIYFLSHHLLANLDSTLASFKRLIECSGLARAIDTNH